MQTAINNEKHVLISTLGMSPYVITETLDALRIKKGILINRVVLVTTNHEKIYNDVEDEKEWGYYQKLVDHVKNSPCRICNKHYRQIEFEDCKRIDNKDILEEKDFRDFLNLLLKQLDDEKYKKEGEEVKIFKYVSVSGGRKDMGTLAMLACLLTPVEGIYHVTVDDDTVENRERKYDEVAKSPVDRKRYDEEGLIWHYEDDVRLMENPFIGPDLLLSALILTSEGREELLSQEMKELIGSLKEQEVTKKAINRIHETIRKPISKLSAEEVLSILKVEYDLYHDCRKSDKEKHRQKNPSLQECWENNKEQFMQNGVYDEIFKKIDEVVAQESEEVDFDQLWDDYDKLCIQLHHLICSRVKELSVDFKVYVEDVAYEVYQSGYYEKQNNKFHKSFSYVGEPKVVGESVLPICVDKFFPSKLEHAIYNALYYAEEAKEPGQKVEIEVSSKGLIIKNTGVPFDQKAWDKKANLVEQAWAAYGFKCEPRRAKSSEAPWATIVTITAQKTDPRWIAVNVEIAD